MNKIVKEHYPVDKLPHDLRGNLAKGAHVTVEVTEELERKPLGAGEAIELIQRMRARHKGSFRSQEEIVGEIRELRDEWDD